MNTEAIEKRAEAALIYLSETDELAAHLKFEAGKAESAYKAAVDVHFLTLDGTGEVRKAGARRAAEPLYLTYLESQRAYDEVRNRREHETLVIEWLRSLNANRRQGA